MVLWQENPLEGREFLPPDFRQLLVHGAKPPPDYPFGVTFTGRAWSEPVLLRLAYAFEQATKARRMPPGVPPLEPGCSAARAP